MENFKENINKFRSNIENIVLSREMKDVYERIKIILENDDQINKEIFNSIKNNEYSTVIAEDASGRIPGLMMYELLKKVAEQKNDSLPPKIYFIAGAYGANDIENKNKLTEEYLSDIVLKNQEFHKKVLVVTEYIMEANSLKPVADGLKNKNIKYDILSIGLSVDTWSTLQSKRDKLGNVANAKKDLPDSIFRREDLSGVVKTPDEILSKKSELADQTKINQLRKEIHVVADDLYNDFFVEDLAKKTD